MTDHHKRLQLFLYKTILHSYNVHTMYIQRSYNVEVSISNHEDLSSNVHSTSPFLGLLIKVCLAGSS